MVAMPQVQPAPRSSHAHGTEGARANARPAQPARDGSPTHQHGPDRVVQHPDLRFAGARALERAGEPRTGIVVGEDEVLEAHAGAGRADQGEHRREGQSAVAQDANVVAVAQRRLRDGGQSLERGARGQLRLVGRCGHRG